MTIKLHLLGWPPKSSAEMCIAAVSLLVVAVLLSACSPSPAVRPEPLKPPASLMQPAPTQYLLAPEDRRTEAKRPH